MNLVNRVMSYDKTKNENQEKCNCSECIRNAEISEKREIAWDFKYADDFLIKVENYRMMCREYEILNIINLKYWYKDVKTKNFIWKSLHVHGDKYIYHKSIYVKSKENLIIECRNGHEPFPQRPNDHLNGHGCKLCGIKLAHDKTRMTLKEFIEKANEVHGEGRYDYSEVIYEGNKIYVWIICHEHDEPYRFPQKPCDHLNGRGCPICGGTKKLTLEEFVEQADYVHGVGRYDYSKVNYINYSTEVIIICPNHDTPYEFPQTPRDHLSGHGCPLCGIKKCADNHRLSLEIFINRANKRYGVGRYDYSKVKYMTMNTLVCIICPNHDEPYEFWRTPHSHLNGAGCPLCNEYSGNTKIKVFLNDKNIKFETEKTFDGCEYIKSLRFDFYIPQYNLCIEFDGEQHFEKVNWNGKMTDEELEENLKLNKLRDQIKNDYCKNNRINLLRIRYDENVEEKLTKYFQNHEIIKELTLFDL